MRFGAEACAIGADARIDDSVRLRQGAAAANAAWFKARFYAMARGSATESAAVLDVLWVRGLVDARLRTRARSLLVRIVQMLTRLQARMTADA